MVSENSKNLLKISKKRTFGAQGQFQKNENKSFEDLKKFPKKFKNEIFEVSQCGKMQKGGPFGIF